MRTFLRNIVATVVLLMSLIVNPAKGQTGSVYPVDLNVMLAPPFGTCLTDLTNTNRFVIQALLRDMNHGNDYQMVIQMRVKSLSSLNTVFLSHTKPFSIGMGKPTVVLSANNSTVSISDFFDEANILALPGSVRLNNNCLPEGSYMFCFQAFDAMAYFGGQRIPISKEFALTAFMEDGAAPILLSPRDNDMIPCMAPDINFMWQQPFVTSGLNTYTLQIAEVTDPSHDSPQVLETGNILEYKGLMVPMKNVNVTEAKFQKEHTYYWRVIMCDKNGTPRYNYPNKGASPAYRFVYCGTPQEPEPEDPWEQKVPQAKAIGKGLDTLRMDSVRVDEATTCTAIWFKDSVEVREKYDGVIIEVKKTTQDTWTPFKLESTVRTDTTIELSSLSYNDSFMVRGQYYMLEEGKPVYAPYSDTVYFRIKHPADTVDCGAPIPELTDCSGSGERSEFRLGDRFSANGTSVTIDSIISQKVNGSSLTLTGLGHIPFPILSNFGLKVSFTDVEINCDNQLKRGKVISVYDEKTAAMIDLNNIIGKGSAGNDLGQSDAILNDGGGDVSNLSEGDVILNDDNKVTVKDPDGNEISVGTIIDLSSSSVYSDNTSLKDSKVYIKFSNPDYENIAFDDDDQNLRKSSFTLAENYRDFGGGYIIPWVASNPGRKFQLKATPSDNFKSEGYTDVKFVIPASSGKHIELESEANGDDYMVSIPGISTNKQSTVYAIARKSADSPYENVGKLNLCCYTYKTKKIVIVPLEEGITVSADEVKTALEKIYGKLGYTFEVEVDKAHSNGVRKSIALESTVMSEFSSDMKEVINGYKANIDADASYSYDKEAAYLFLMDKPEGSFAETKGIMPQKQQFGFIFMQGSQSVSSAETHTMAHELGHGLFGLDHVFIKSYGITEGSTHNLMDYTKNTPDDFLSYHEWSQINSPVMSWSLFNSDEGNMAFNKDNSFFCICNDEIVKKISSYKYFYAPDGTIIDIKDYKVCGFVNEDDGVESARGSVFAIKVDQFTAKHQFYESEYEGVNKVKVNGKYCSTAGYGFSDGEMQITLVDINEIRNTDKSINVHRVYLKDKKITIVKVEGDNQKVVETISYEEPCKCSETVSPHYLRSFFQLTENEKSQVKEKAKILIKTDKSYSYLSWGNLTALVDKFTNEVNSIKESTDKREAYYKNFLDERLVDKLKTYELMNPERRIFIIPMNINQFSSSCIFWNLLSERVFAKSGLKCGDILITIPYVKIKEITGNTTGNYYMPSVESIDCVDIEYDEIAKRSNIGPVIADGKISGEIQDFILDVFTWISKKVLEYHGYYYAHNDQITISKWDNKGEEVSGKSYNCNVFLHQQSDVPSIIAQNKEFESEYSRKFWLSVFSSFTAGQQAKYSNMVTEEEIKSVTEAIRRAEAQYEEAYEYKKKKMLEVIKLIEDLAEQGNDFANYSPKGFVPKFKEEFIDSPNTTLNLQNPDGTICNNAESYIRTEAFNEIRKDLGITEEPDFDYDKSHFHNTTREYLSYYMRDASPYVYGALDVTSVILGFWGLDPIADALGVAYAVVVLDEDQAASYSMNLVVMGPTGVLATKAVTGLKKGANYIRVKYAKDTELVAEILDKNQLGDKALMMIAEDYKTKNIISEEGFNRLSKFKGDDLDEAIKAELRRSEGAASEVKKADDAASESKKADDAANESKKADDAANEAKKQKLPAEYVDDFCNKGDLIKGNKEKRNEIKNELTKKFETFHDGGKQICEDFIDASRAVTGRKTLLNDLKNFDRWKEMYEYRIPDVYRKNVKFYSIWDDVKNFPDPTKIFKDFEDNPAPFLEIVKKGEGKLFVDRWKALNDLRVPDQFRKDPFFVDLWGDEAKVLIKEGKIANVNTTIYVKDFIEGALGEVLSYTLAYAIMNDKINITDFSKDVLRAGYINAIKPSGVFKNYMNCVQNMDIDKLQNILKDIIHGETYTLAIDILHQIFDCASGWIFGSDVFKKNLSKVRDFLLSNPEAYAKALRKIFPKEARFISRYILELADDKDIFEIIPQSVKNKLNSVIGNAYHKFRGKGTDILYYVKYSESEVGVGFIVDFAQDQIFRTFYIKAGKAFDTIDGNIELINEKNEIKNFFDLVEEVKEVVVNLK